MTRKTLEQYIDEFLTPDNARQYWQTQDKYLFVEYLTDLPNNSKILDELDEAFWKYCEAEQAEMERFDFTNKHDR
jgi:hypothetical protein